MADQSEITTENTAQDQDFLLRFYALVEDIGRKVTIISTESASAFPTPSKVQGNLAETKNTPNAKADAREARSDETLKVYVVGGNFPTPRTLHQTTPSFPQMAATPTRITKETTLNAPKQESKTYGLAREEKQAPQPEWKTEQPTSSGQLTGNNKTKFPPNSPWAGEKKQPPKLPTPEKREVTPWDSFKSLLGGLKDTLGGGKEQKQADREVYQREKEVKAAKRESIEAPRREKEAYQNAHKALQDFHKAKGEGKDTTKEQAAMDAAKARLRQAKDAKQEAPDRLSAAKNNLDTARQQASGAGAKAGLGKAADMANKAGFQGIGGQLGEVAEAAKGGELGLALLAAKKTKEQVEKVGSGLKQAATSERGGEQIGGLAKAGGAVSTLSGIGVIAAPMFKFVEIVAEGTEKLRKWNDEIFNSNMKFAEFSSAMAGVQARQEVRDFQLNKQIGDERAPSAETQAQGMHALNEQMARIESPIAILKNEIVGKLSETIASILKVLLDTFWFLQKDKPAAGNELIDFAKQTAHANNIYQEAMRKFKKK